MIRTARRIGVLATVVAIALVACGDDDAADESTTTERVPVTTEQATTTTEKPECEDSEDRGVYEDHQLCVQGEWTANPLPRPTTTTAAPTTTTTVPEPPCADGESRPIANDPNGFSQYCTSGVWVAAEASSWWRQLGYDERTRLCGQGYEAARPRLVTLVIKESDYDSLCATHASAPAPFTDDEIAAVIVPAANAWLADPNADTLAALSATAEGLATSGRLPGGEVGTGLGNSAIASGVRQLRSPSDDNAVVGALIPFANYGATLPVYVEEGTYTVGQDIEPGTYRALNVTDCYWATLDEAGEINDNNFVNSAPQVLATVRASDFAFENDCGLMVKVG